MVCAHRTLQHSWWHGQITREDAFSLDLHSGLSHHGTAFVTIEQCRLPDHTNLEQLTLMRLSFNSRKWKAEERSENMRAGMPESGHVPNIVDTAAHGLGWGQKVVLINNFGYFHKLCLAQVKGATSMVLSTMFSNFRSPTPYRPTALYQVKLVGQMLMQHWAKLLHPHYVKFNSQNGFKVFFCLLSRPVTPLQWYCLGSPMCLNSTKGMVLLLLLLLLLH